MTQQGAQQRSKEPNNAARSPTTRQGAQQRSEEPNNAARSPTTGPRCNEEPNNTPNSSSTHQGAQSSTQQPNRQHVRPDDDVRVGLTITRRPVDNAKGSMTMRGGLSARQRAQRGCRGVMTAWRVQRRAEPPRFARFPPFFFH